MRTRKAILPDAQQIHELISAYSGDGTLLPRTLPEICENVRDFVVLEDDGRIIGRCALGSGQRRRRTAGEIFDGRGQAASRGLHLSVYA